jgi:short subunit dehydrogenase-like uncharacterized protein
MPRLADYNSSTKILNPLRPLRGVPVMNGYLIYGANGYTGELIAKMAQARGHRPILAGRSQSVAELATKLNLPYRLFELSQAQEHLGEVRVVLHCAGPFSRTAQPMVDACLARGVHYLDVTGEVGVFEAIAKRSDEARSRGVMLLPGVGFDVVPTDCLALHLKNRLPEAVKLALGFQMSGGLSRGTATTMAESLDKGGAVRKSGRLKRVWACWKTRVIDFGRGPRMAMTIPWGDLATAYRTTGIGDIETYLSASWKERLIARLSRPFGWLLGRSSVQAWIKRKIQKGPPGPSDEARERGRSLVWGEVCDANGYRAVSRLRGPEGYTMTGLCALAVVERVLAGEVRAGFQTPGLMYGADFVLSIPGVEREDVPVRK